MAHPSVLDFTTTPSGVDFFRKYDRVLEKWPIGTVGLDLDSEYGTTRVNACGPVDAPPVLLLPGAGATSTVWFANAAALAERYRVLAVDLMGDAGRSAASGRRIRGVDDLLGWIDTVAQGTGLDSFAVVGHSYGAMIALAYALGRPDRVRKMALLDPNSCFAGMRPGYLARAVPLLVRPTEKRERHFIRWETDRREVDESWLDLIACGTASFPKSKTVVPKRPSREAVSALTVDTTVILAAESRVHDSKSVAAAIGASAPRLRTCVIEGATHHTMPMSPATAVSEAILAAIDGPR
ncbi:alpha/beta hydrolase [Rhodococcus spelaei]|uniref:Alpha/beta hydrolase n=1 Tax=Rhodococcus spelaei TaxID=2546320 RepID=A0A541B1Q2_9NOCA|nr:alpha/beta fold hydrolase [Rhodococcus spelaei]TQF66252.1 alpha/beta hydrolase [Rhodococcus spelaei]